MNKLINSVLHLLVLFCCLDSIKTQQQLTSLELKISKTEYLVGDLITVDVLIKNLPIDKDVNITVKGKSNKDTDRILQCIDCSPKLFRAIVNLESVDFELNDNQSRKNESYYRNPDDQLIVHFKWKAIEASKLTLYIETNLEESLIDDSKIRFIEIGIIRSKILSVLAEIFGWSYFIFWLICFYPQVYLNWKTKSCIGLNIDYCVLNFIGFLFYAVYNVAIYFVDAVQAEYEKVYPYSNIPVLTNDIVFSLHHLIVSLIIAVQCMFIYDNGNQSFSRSCILSLTVVFSGFFILSYYVFVDKFSLLDYIYYFGFIKMLFTALKYIPQVYSHYREKSTIGWSVSFNIYDILGGVSCLVQMLILIHNYRDWSFITKNIAKTGIALLTLVFDIAFLIQHFFLYGNEAQLAKNKISYGSTQVHSPNQADSSIILFKNSNDSISFK